MIKTATKSYPKQECSFYNNDIWYIDKIGVEAPPYISTKYLSFKCITPDWLCNLVKKFILYQAPTKALYTLQQYLRSFVHFSKFLSINFPTIEQKNINRTVMLGFIGHIRQLKQANEAKNKLITHIKLLITLAELEGWENVTKEKIMYREDRLPVYRTRPRFIPNMVLEQLQLHISKLPTDIMNVVLLLQHTGRRLGEICALSFDCLRQDEDGDYILLYYEFKMKREESIPVNKQVVSVIEQQKEWLRTYYHEQKSKYLFPDPNRPTIFSNKVRQALKHPWQSHSK
jgi:integrase